MFIGAGDSRITAVKEGLFHLAEKCMHIGEQRNTGVPMDARMYTTDEIGIPRRSAQPQKVGSDSKPVATASRCERVDKRTDASVTFCGKEP